MSWLRSPGAFPPGAHVFTPADIAGLKIWLRADQGAGSSDGDAVGTWIDQSGAAHNFTQATGSKKPTYKVNIRNGLPVVRFDGTDDQLDGGDLSSVFTTGGTIFAVLNHTEANTKTMPYETKNNDPWWSFSGAGYFGNFRSTRLANTPSSGIPTSGWHIWAITADNGSNYKVWLDNASIISAGSFTFDGGNEHILGYQKQNNDYMGFDFGELAVFDSALVGTDLSDMYEYMYDRWMLLPATPATVYGIGAVPTPTAYGNEAYSSVVNADAPVGYWRLGDTSGTTATDSSGHSYAGTYTNGPTLNQTSLITDTSDTAVLFDGNNDYVDLGSPTALRLYSAWTLEGWIKVTTGQTLIGTFITQAYDGSRVPFALGGFDGSSHTLKPAVGFYNGSWHTAVAPSAITANTTHHIAGTWDGTTLRIYVDGVEVNSSVPGSSPSSGNTGNLYIGSRWDNTGDGQKFAGTLDEIAVWDRALSAGRIQAHYIAGTQGVAATATPSATAGTGAVPGATAMGASTALPTVTGEISAVPASTASGTSTTAPGAVAGIGAVPAATAIGDLGVANPSVTAGVGAVPAAAATVFATATPSVVAGIGAVPASSVTGQSNATPSAVAGVGDVPAATAGGVVSPTAGPPTVSGVGRVPHPHAVGQGTGGGGGTSNGATDFWTIKALG